MTKRLTAWLMATTFTLGGVTIAYAGGPHVWNDDDVLSASHLNESFAALEARIAELERQPAASAEVADKALDLECTACVSSEELAHVPKLSCRIVNGEHSRGNYFAIGSTAFCAAEEVLTGGACPVQFGKGTSAGNAGAFSNGYGCILTTDGGDPNETVIAEAICCKL